MPNITKKKVDIGTYNPGLNNLNADIRLINRMIKMEKDAFEDTGQGMYRKEMLRLIDKRVSWVKSNAYINMTQAQQKNIEEQANPSSEDKALVRRVQELLPETAARFKELKEMAQDE